MGKIDFLRRGAEPPHPRQVIEDEIERLIGLLDVLDGDADFEPDADSEPWLASFGGWVDAGGDREEDESDERVLPVTGLVAA